ncbi:MAG: hypothetical protein PHW00_03755 [Clostridia bacterium]|nr:hypothetical protein [Clostridia bacterium]
MNYPKAKIYTDGSHYIAIPHEEHPERRKKNIAHSTSDDKKAAFETAYDENKTKKKAERTESVVENIKENFDSETEAEEFVAQKYGAQAKKPYSKARKTLTQSKSANVGLFRNVHIRR